MNFELLLFIFTCILLGVLAFDYRKKRLAKTADENTDKAELFKRNSKNNTNLDKKETQSFFKGEYVSKSRVVKRNNFKSNIDNNDTLDKNTKKNNNVKFISLYVQAKEQDAFLGNDLLRVLLSLGCRYGDMNIFHRHENKNGLGKEIFSVASMLEPGTFDLNKLPETNIPGVVLFFSTNNCILLDSSRNLLTSEKVTHINELLASYTNDAEEDVF